MVEVTLPLAASVTLKFAEALAMTPEAETPTLDVPLTDALSLRSSYAVFVRVSAPPGGVW
ncbi:MAG: hypothetical protein WCF36_08715 [Candidatus Nanopelagicales bacterium]